MRRYAVYPFAEMVLVESNGDTAVDVLSIPEGTIIEQLLTRTYVPATGSANLTIGDDDDPDGFIVAADATAAEGTVYGDDPTERGDYLYDATKKGSFVKLYEAAKTLKLVLSAAPTSEGEYEVIVIGHRTVLNQA